MAIEFACECGKELRSKSEFAGKKTKCPACGAVLFIPKPEPPPGAKPEPSTKPASDPASEAIAVDWSMPEAPGASPAASQAQPEAGSGLIRMDAVAPSAAALAAGSAPIAADGHHSYKVLTPKDYGIAAKFNPEALEKSLNEFARHGWSLKSAVVMSVPTHAGAHDELIVILEH